MFWLLSPFLFLIPCSNMLLLKVRYHPTIVANKCLIFNSKYIFKFTHSITARLQFFSNDSMNSNHLCLYVVCITSRYVVLISELELWRNWKTFPRILALRDFALLVNHAFFLRVKIMVWEGKLAFMDPFENYRLRNDGTLYSPAAAIH